MNDYKHELIRWETIWLIWRKDQRPDYPLYAYKNKELAVDMCNALTRNNSEEYILEPLYVIANGS